MADLEKIGDAHRRRLNLLRKDAAMSPIIRGVNLLKKIAPDLGRLKGLSLGDRDQLKKNLEIASRLLNTEGYEAVRSLLDELRLLSVDADLLKTVYDRVVREPSFSETRFKPLGLNMGEHSSYAVMIPKSSFEDIMTNIIRNAIQSTIQYPLDSEAVEIGLKVGLERDSITGIERVVFWVQDRSQEKLTVEMLRGRYIEEGLGLTADLVSRHDGTLDVASCSEDWSKSVVVKLRSAEIEGDGDEK